VEVVSGSAAAAAAAVAAAAAGSGSAAVATSAGSPVSVSGAAVVTFDGSIKPAFVIQVVASFVSFAVRRFKFHLFLAGLVC
jgi:hypothetical protein